MAAGLLAAAIGGFGKALSDIGEMEAKKQNEAKLRREIMNMESEERLRLNEIEYKRDLSRLPEKARVQAEANVVGEQAGFEAANRAGLPAIRAQAKVDEKTAQYQAEDKAGLTTMEAKREAEKLKAGLTAKSEAGLPEAQGAYAAREKIEARLAELNLSTLKNLSVLEAKAKYDALVADIDAAEKSGIDVKEAKRKANIILADINAKKAAGVPKAEAGYSADKKLEELRAVTEKNLIKEEADYLAKQELAKVQAMTAQGVPEAEAKLLAAKWRAGKTQRDEAAAEKTQQEITAEIAKARSLAGNKTYLSDVGKIDIAKGAGERFNAQFRENLKDTSDKKERSRNTIEMERQIKETNNEIGRIIGIGDPKKIPDELSFLESQANKGDAKAIEKLKKIKPLLNELDSLSRDLRSYKRGGSSGTAGESTSSSGKRPDISSFNK